MSGAIIVTTPQDIALLDARKGLKMFEKVQCAGAWHRREHERCIPAAKCGHTEEHMFGEGGGETHVLRTTTSNSVLGQLAP